MKTAIFYCFPQFSSKNSKNVYPDQILKQIKLQRQCKIVQNVRFSLYMTRFMKSAIFYCFPQFSSKHCKQVYQDQILKKVKLQYQCKIVQNVRFRL